MIIIYAVKANKAIAKGKDQSQVSKAIDKLVEVGLVVKKEGRLIAQ